MDISELESRRTSPLAAAYRQLANARNERARFVTTSRLVEQALADFESSARSTQARSASFTTFAARYENVRAFFHDIFTGENSRPPDAPHEPLEAQLFSLKVANEFYRAETSTAPAHDIALSVARQIHNFRAAPILHKYLKELRERIAGRHDQSENGATKRHLADLLNSLPQHQRHWGQLANPDREFRVMRAAQSRVGQEVAQWFIDEHLEPIANTILMDGMPVTSEPQEITGGLDISNAQKVLQELQEKTGETLTEADTWIAELEQQLLQHGGSLDPDPRDPPDLTEWCDLEPPPELLEAYPMQMPEEVHTFIFLVPHEDDISKFAAVIAHYKALGRRIVGIVTTDGSGGTIQNPLVDTPAAHRNFSESRTDEAERAYAALGVDVMYKLNFGDSGMADDPSKHLLRLKDIADIVVAERLGEIIWREGATAVVTLQDEAEQSLSYEHPDHVATVKAGKLTMRLLWEKYEWSPMLYQTTLKAETFTYDHPEWQGNYVIDLKRPPNLPPPTAIITVDKEAQKQHASTMGKFVGQIDPESPLAKQLPGETFSFVQWPPRPPDEPVKTDLLQPDPSTPAVPALERNLILAGERTHVGFDVEIPFSAINF